MPRKHAFGLLLISLTLIVGVTLLLRRTGPAQEGVARETAVRLALGPEAAGGDAAGMELPESLTGSEVAPVLVELSALPPAAPETDGMLERWQAGGLDLETLESPLSEAAVQALQEAAQLLPASPNVQNVDPAAPTALTPGISFAALDYTECCGGSGSVPPDPDVAVGPNHIVAVVNVAFEIYSKSGSSLVAPRTFANLFGSVPGCNGADNTLSVRSGLFDPNILYDEAEDRFIIAIDRIRSNVFTGAIENGSHYCVGVSATNSPTGSWFLYAFPMDTSNPGNVWMDYPSAGIGRDALYMGGNIFTTGLAPSFVQSRVWAFRKSQLMAGQPTAPVEKSVADNFTPQPLNLHGYDQGTWPPSGPHYFLAIDDDVNGTVHRLLSWNNPFAAPTPPVSVVTTLNLSAAAGASTGFPVNWPQLGGGAILANDWRPLDFEYRNGYAWTAANVSCVPPGGGTVNCLRWAQISLSTFTIVNAGVYASIGNYRTFPDLAVNHCNDMSMGFTKGSASSYPGTFVTGRQASDGFGLLQGDMALKAGEITYTAFDSPPRRWGDYTGMAIDPNGETFWYIGQYSKNTGDTNGFWGTYIGSFAFPTCDAPSPPPTPIPGAVKTNLPAVIMVSTPAPTPTATAVPPAPQPGHWQSYDAAVEFDVSGDQQWVHDLRFYFRVNGCGDTIYSASANAAIQSKTFSFTGSFFGTGIFSDATHAAGLVGLYDYYIPGCGYVYTPADVPWTAVWVGTALGPAGLTDTLVPTVQVRP